LFLIPGNGFQPFQLNIEMEKEVLYIDIYIYIECGENFKPKSKKNSILVHGYFGEYT